MFQFMIENHSLTTIIVSSVMILLWWMAEAIVLYLYGKR